MTHKHEERNVSIAIIAIVAALGLFGVVVITAAVTIPHCKKQKQLGAKRVWQSTLQREDASEARRW
jgi:hypothetical protein